MIVLRFLASLVLVLAGLTPAPASAAEILNDLDPEQKSQLEKGELIVRSEDVKGGRWPKLMLYTKVDAPVSSVEGVFRDYAGASSYIPNLISAEVLEHPSKDVYRVRYTQTMPLLGDSVSTVINRYSYEGSTLVVRWNLVEANYADVSEGELRVEPLGKGAVLRYTNYVKPKSSLAVMAKGAALGEARKTVLAIKAESEKRHAAGE